MSKIASSNVVWLQWNFKSVIICLVTIILQMRMLLWIEKVCPLPKLITMYIQVPIVRPLVTLKRPILWASMVQLTLNDNLEMLCRIASSNSKGEIVAVGSRVLTSLQSPSSLTTLNRWNLSLKRFFLVYQESFITTARYPIVTLFEWTSLCFCCLGVE